MTLVVTLQVNDLMSLEALVNVSKYILILLCKKTTNP